MQTLYNKQIAEETRLPCRYFKMVFSISQHINNAFGTCKTKLPYII